jgi:hypothetical protein
MSRDYLLQLLKAWKIEEFNELRKQDNYSRLEFDSVDLSDNSLESINLKTVNLSQSRLI